MIPFETEWKMLAVPSSSPSNCPNCEFLGKKPRLSINCNNDILMCQVCGTKWREVSTHLQKNEPALFLPMPVTRKNTIHKISSFVIVFTFVSLAGLLLLNEWTTQIPDEITVSSISQKHLSLSRISTEIFDNSNGGILIVSGEVRNNSPFSQRVPSVVMYSGRKGSSGYYYRIYHPALQNLAPGASFRFRISIRKPKGNTGSIKLKFSDA